ncbi:meiotic nuclear division protein 1 homolog [Sitophilus oryzae]|uniref:Meiotic nuclear division protein 1 homolog n=1 Tax=Sitophilus oryzae TaxID=7048 RepID=A0A6J2XU00_SITOR|nr:meiotic nuclear division protein 1 homolog [Sitophilus oryzae]
MAKKGLSVEEKKGRMLELFYETGECYQIKELEKVAPKLKGIVVNSVKDIVEKLVDDGLVDTDKIGTSVYFWAFPSKATKNKSKNLNDLIKEQKKVTETLEALEKSVEASKNTKTDEDELAKILAEIKAMEKEIDTAKKKLNAYKENGSKKVKAMAKKTAELKDAANRWTDNIFAIKSWCKKKFPVEDKDIDKQFGIPDDFDYI